MGESAELSPLARNSRRARYMGDDQCHAQENMGKLSVSGVPLHYHQVGVSLGNVHGVRPVELFWITPGISVGTVAPSLLED